MENGIGFSERERDIIDYFNMLAGTYPVTCGEGACANAIKDVLSECADCVKIDSLGNVIASKSAKSPTGKKLLYCASIDVPGFSALGVEPDGRVRLEKLGDFDSNGVLYSNLVFADTCEMRDAVLLPDGNGTYLAATDISDRDEVERAVKIGQSVAIKKPFTFFSDGSVYGFRVGTLMCAATLMKIFAESKPDECGADIYALFAVQSSLGARGFDAAINAVRPQYVIQITSGEKKLGGVGSGAKLIVKYKNGVSSEALCARLLECDKSLTPCVSDLSGNELAMAIRAGAEYASVGIPCENPGTLGERVSVRDCGFPPHIASLV